MAALMVLIGASAGEAFGWGRSYYPCYQSSGYTYYYYYPAQAYYYPSPAPAGVSAVAPPAGQPYVAMKPVTEATPSPAVIAAPVQQYYAPAVSGGSYYGGNAPRTSWDFGKFPHY
jgi:hypothetical protein